MPRVKVGDTTAALAVRPAPHLEAIDAYPLAVLQASGERRLISLAQNESACPPSPAALHAAQAAVSDATLYPDPDWTELRAAIATVHDLDPQTILCGAGSMELMLALARAYLAPGDRALTSAHAYLYFRTAAQLAGASIDLAPEAGLTVDPCALLECVTSATRMVFVANPGNPTGTRIGRRELLALRAALRPDIVLVIDEAYGEFADDQGESMFDLPARGDTVVLRSFSKAYGLAGLRAGWGVFPPAVAVQVRKAMPPNNLSAPAQAAAASAVRDQSWMRAMVATTVARRERFIARVRRCGVAVPNSVANFALLDFGTPAIADRADAALRAEGIAVRSVAGYGLPHCLRATVGAEEHMNRAAAIIEGAMAKGCP